ncbi:ras-related and estrogen-regulated growth inhibitor-like protein isoform X2 [Anas acuta]|uniref:ras-related and estrogen-regulated growth inhibitor-like protein isoform X2 n=1 Tax=Anas acuta TaxID=28680 RepID=UPI0035C8C8CB
MGWEPQLHKALASGSLSRWFVGSESFLPAEYRAAVLFVEIVIAARSFLTGEDSEALISCLWTEHKDQADDGSSEEKRIQWADSFVLVYSICDRASFDILPPKIQFIKAAKEGQSQEKVPIVIVGNKRDLHHQREVSSEEGRLLALSLDCGFYEVSAAEAYHGALMVFHGLAERIPDTKLALKKGTGIRGIVKTMSAVFARKRTDSL